MVNISKEHLTIPQNTHYKNPFLTSSRLVLQQISWDCYYSFHFRDEEQRVRKTDFCEVHQLADQTPFPAHLCATHSQILLPVDSGLSLDCDCCAFPQVTCVFIRTYTPHGAATVSVWIPGVTHIHITRAGRILSV